MFRRFLSDTKGNFAVMTVIATVPIIGALALAIDYGELTRQRQATLNALDAAGLATARQIQSGVTDTEAKKYAKDFFEANLNHINPAKTTLHVTLPEEDGGSTLKLAADLVYDPYFLPAFTTLIGKDTPDLGFTASSEIRLKNTIEVALVLDNSGSMDYKATGSGKKRMELLKAASKQLVDTISDQAKQMKQIDKPVQFALVPFAASVNVGPDHKTSSWMDTQGLSPIHYEIFKFSKVSDTKTFKQNGNSFFKEGSGWPSAEANQRVTRFTLFDELKRTTCVGKTCAPQSFVKWGGCVESRPYPHNINDTVPSTSQPASLFVPMFAPDEPGNRWVTQKDSRNKDVVVTYSAANSWWDDAATNTPANASAYLARQENITKYFVTAPENFSVGDGPNYSCTTKPITPLTDVSTSVGIATIKTAIDGMESNGATNVPEGLAWGWRVLSSGEPFTGGRPEKEKGNDKIVIVLTDGENTYYTPSSLGFSDPAGNLSTYSAYGYARVKYNGGDTRLYQNTSSAVGKTTYTNANYTTALNEHFAKKTGGKNADGTDAYAGLCANAKDAKIIIMTVALDLSEKDAGEKAQIEALKECSSHSRFTRDSNGKPRKLFWNTTGGDLGNTFKDISNELSNLRIVG